MPAHDITPEKNEYRLVLLPSRTHAVLMQQDDDGLSLPRLAIPDGTRPAEQLQSAIRKNWNLRAIVLDFLAIGSKSTPCAVVEILNPVPDTSLLEASIDKIADKDLVPEERGIVEAILAGDVDRRGPFSRVGWVQDAMEWMQSAIGRDVAFTGEIRQLNASGNFALARFATQSGPAYWLKATGQPNTHEFQITRLLAELSPGCIPRRVAEREDWNCWLMEEAGRPRESWTLTTLEQAVRAMAHLQHATTDWTSTFLKAGAFDQRIGVLRAHLDELIEYLDQAMTKQVSTKVHPIGSRRLAEIGRILLDACLLIEALGIPESLMHNDVNAGNILFEGEHCVFTDWCEVGVGNPLLSFEYLCLLCPKGENWRPALRNIYKQVWLDHLNEAQIDRAFVLAPLLAILAHFYGRGTWLRSEQRNDPAVQSYARCLARHMDRAAQDRDLLEALCH